MSRTYKDRPEDTWNWFQATRRGLDPRYGGLWRNWRVPDSERIYGWNYWYYNYNHDQRPDRSYIRKTRTKNCTCRGPEYCGCNDLVRATKIDWGFRGKRWVKYRYVRWDITPTPGARGAGTH